MTITPESMKALKRRVSHINHEIAMLDDRRVKLQRQATSANRRVQRIVDEISKLDATRDKIKQDTL